jgi:phenylpropionate dioxygenase-like ring-hydroxylating dioxygenase large terminal subunit
MLGGVMYRNPRTNTPLATVLEELQSAAALPFDQAGPIPPSVNHSLEFLDFEREVVFQQEWICVGREDEIPANGDFLTHQIAEVPVLVVRQPDTEIKASGQLVRAPYMEMKDGFDVTRHRLRPLQLSTWEGFIYVTLAENPSTQLGEALAPLREQVVARYDMACYQTVLRESMEWNANWKNLIENFSESYHVPIAHGKTFAQHNKPPQDYVCGEDSAHYCYHRAPQAAATGPGAAHPKNDRLEGEWRRMMIDFCVFPNHLVTLMPDYLWYISVQPRGIGKMYATWGLAVPPEVLADVGEADFDDWLAQFKHYMEVANGEDKILVEALHLGSASPILPGGAYHPIERNLWQFTNYLAGRCKP